MYLIRVDTHQEKNIFSETGNRKELVKWLSVLGQAKLLSLHYISPTY